jgi:hypothetical protein
MTGWGRVRRARKQADRTYQVRLQALNDLLGEALNHKYAENPLREGLRHSWKLRAITVTSEILGQIHPLVSEVRELWVSEEPDDWEELKEWEKDYWWRAEGILKATIISYTFMNIKVQDSTVANALDRDLLARVEHVFRLEDWTAVASLAATFVEDRFRNWAGLDESSFGVNLMTKVLHPENGIFPLGTSAAEREGWHQLGRGFMSACSNVDRHRIQNRTDLRHYAVGVLGAASLLLTQMRYQHGNRFMS